MIFLLNTRRPNKPSDTKVLIHALTPALVIMLKVSRIVMLCVFDTAT